MSNYRVTRGKRYRSTSHDAERDQHALHGGCRPGLGFEKLDGAEDVVALRAYWAEHRERLLGEWIAEHPGERPHAWWLFDAVERRQRIDGVQHPFENRVRRAHIEKSAKVNPSFKEAAYKLFRGRPNCLFTRDDFDAKYESEAEYLRRLNLLTPEERAEIFE